MAGQSPTTITKRNVLAVEGADENNFFQVLLRHAAITEIQIVEAGGKNQFKNRLPELLMIPGFYLPDGSPFVERLAIVRDKDQDDAFQSIANIVQKAGLAPPGKHGEFSDGDPKVGIFIMPGEQATGTMLEDLCLEAVQMHPAMECVREFAACIERLLNAPTNSSKAQCQAFLAAQPEIVNCVGLGAQKGYWDLDSPSLDELKAFLMHMK